MGPPKYAVSSADDVQCKTASCSDPVYPVVFSDPKMQTNSKETSASVALVNIDESTEKVISGGACVANSDNSSKVTTSGDICVVNPDKSKLETKSEETCVGNSDESPMLMTCLFNNNLVCNPKEDSLDELESAYVITSARGSGTSTHLVLSVKNRTSLYDKHALIWDTAASVHIIRNLDLFEGTPTPVKDDDISFVGFDTSSGNSFPVSKGILAYPFEGIEAYHSPNCIGNIISEAKFRQEFHVEDKRNRLNYKLDTMITYRMGSKGSESRLKWVRGAEDIFVTDLRNPMCKETLVSVESSATSLKMTETETIVEDWLRKLGLTNQEALGSLLLSRVNSSERRKVITACFVRHNMTVEEIKRVFDFYAITSVKARQATPPVVNEFMLMINSLRAMSINDSTTTPKRGRIDEVTGDSDLVSKSLQSSGTENSSGNSKRLKPRPSADGAVCTSSEAEPYALTSSYLSNIDTDDCGRSSEAFMSNSSTMAATHTGAESQSKQVRSSYSVTADELNRSIVDVAYSQSSISTVAKNSESRSSTGGGGHEIHGKQDTTESNVETLNAEGTLSSLWLWNSTLSTQEVLVSLLISEVGLASESKLVLLTLEQQGLSKAAIQRIGLVERWHKMTSFIGLKTLALMIKHGTVKDIQGLSVLDVQNYHKYVHETDCACILGKMRVHSAPNFDNVLYSPNACFCDVMQLTTSDKVVKFHFLISIDATSQFIFCIYLAKLNNIELAKAFKKLIAQYRAKSSQTVLKQIILDNAGSLKSESTKELIKSCYLDPIYVTPAEHVKIAEAGIRVIKSLVRTTVLDSATSKKFVIMFVPYLMDWVVGSINYSLRTGSDYASPYTRFTGKLVSANIQFRAAFLDIVAVNDIQDKSTNLDSRARIGLVLARDESERGALLLLDIASGQLMKRTHFHIADGPSYKEKVTSFLASGKLRKMKVFDVDKLEKFHGPSEDFDTTLDSYKTAVDFADSLDFNEDGVDDVSEDPDDSQLESGSSSEIQRPIVAIPLESETPEEFNPADEVMAVTIPIESKTVKPVESARVMSEVTPIVENKDLEGSILDILRSDSPPPPGNGPIEYVRNANGLSYDLDPKPRKARRVIMPTSVFKLSNDDAFAIRTEADGSCLLNAVSWFFEDQAGYSPLELRDMVCNYIQCNACEPFEESGISILDIIKAGLSQEESILLSDESIIENYVSNLRLTTTWFDDMEINVLARILKIAIVVFQPKHNGFYVIQSISIKYKNVKLSIVPIVRVKDKHYESLNIIHSVHRKALKEWLSITDEEGDESLPHFKYHKAFATHREVVMSVTPPNIPNNNLNSNMCVDELEEDYKIRKLLCLLTIEEPSNKPSEGVSSLKSRRPSELDQAQEKEVNQVHERKVWELVFPKDITEDMLKKLIPLIMLNKEKCFSDGKFDKIKARLVALGCRQQLMEDELKEAPTASIQSFYLIILLAAKLRIKLRSKDVTGAFLHADLQEGEEEFVLISKKHVDLLLRKHKEVAKYVRQNGTLIALLKKCLYGLKQSPQRWYDTIRKILEGIGMQATSGDKCLFYELQNGYKNYLLLFVDDMLIAFQSNELLHRLSEALINEFGEITDQVGPVMSFLGITITQSDEEITLDQTGFINKLVGSLKLNRIPQYSNPAASDFSVYQQRFLKPQSQADPERLTQMRRLTMSVMYCALRTRRDVLFLASFLASIKCPEKEDIEAIQRVIIYLSNTVNKKQHFYSAGALKLILFGDASHNAFVDGKGQGCKIIYGDENSAAIDMNSSKEKAVTDSSCESEVIVQSSLGQNGIFFYNQLGQLGVKVPLPMIMYCDNEAAVTLANRKEIHVLGRTKFFNRLIWKIHEAVSNNMVKPTWIASEEMDSDMGTKALMGSNFDRVSNRSFSRMYPKIEAESSEFNDPWRKENMVVKRHSKTVSFDNVLNSSKLSESASPNDNQLNGSVVDSSHGPQLSSSASTSAFSVTATPSLDKQKFPKIGGSIHY